MENVGMTKQDWIIQYKKGIEDSEKQIKEYESFVQQAKDEEVKNSLERDILFEKMQIVNHQKNIKQLEEEL